MICQKCGSDMWDNRTHKRNPRGPDFKCKDKECGHAVWENSKPRPSPVRMPSDKPDQELLRMAVELVKVSHRSEFDIVDETYTVYEGLKNRMSRKEEPINL